MLRKIIMIAAIMILVFLSVVCYDKFSRDYHHSYDRLIENERSRREIAQNIQEELYLIMLFVNKLVLHDTVRENLLLRQELNKHLKNIRTLVKILDEGGVFIHSIPKNFKRYNSVQDDIRYDPIDVSSYNMDSIKLPPKLDILVNLTNNFSGSVGLVIQKGKDPLSNDAINLEQKQVSAFLEHFAQHIQRVIYNANIRLSQLNQERLIKTGYLNVFYMAVISISFSIIFIVIILTFNQVARLLKERETYAKSLKETSDAVQKIIESLPVGVVVLNKNKHIHTVNNAACELIGVKNPSELIKSDWTQKFCPCRGTTCPFEGSDMSLFVTEYQLERFDGTKRSVIKSTIPVRIFNDLFIIETMMDISDLKRSEMALKKAKEEAERAYKSKSLFIAHIAHEIRTPVTAITGFIRMLQGSALDSQEREQIDMLAASNMLLLELTNDLLDLSKMEAGELYLECIDFNLEYLVEDLIKIIGPRALEKDVLLSYVMHEDVPCDLQGDPTRLRQVILNLLTNAIKFTASGSVTMTITMIKIENNTDVTLQFSVTDTGIGLSDDVKELIFEEFIQADNSIASTYGGTGLGLSICKRLVGMMNGEISVESKLHQGSTFSFTAKFQKSPAIHTDVLPITPEHLFGKRAILVDESQHSIHVIENMCEMYGMNVRLFTYAKTASEWAASVNDDDIPDIALLDIAIPSIEGTKLIKYLRAEPFRNRTKLVIISSDLNKGAARRMQEYGFHAFIPEHVAESELLKVICTVLGDRRPEGQIVTRHMADELACKGTRILLAEDNEINQKLIDIMLKKMGCDVDIVSNGHEAIERLQASTYDVVLMDLQMPGVNGIEAAQIIRTEYNNDIPIIALSASINSRDTAANVYGLMNDSLAKPIDGFVLKEKILKWRKTNLP